MLKLATAFEIKKTLGISVILHGALFYLAIWQVPSEQVPLPIGVELQYGEVASVTPPSKSLNQKPTTAKPSTFVPAAKLDESDGPTEKQEAPQAVAATSEQQQGQSLGNPNGNSAQGALTGQEGVRNGIEVSAEDRYLYELRRLLERKQRYPLMAKKMRQTGTVRVRITLQADGRLTSSEVIEKSKYETLNVAAKSLVQEINGLKPFPQEIRKTSWVIEVPIEYVLN